MKGLFVSCGIQDVEPLRCLDVNTENMNGLKYEKAYGLTN